MTMTAKTMEWLGSNRYRSYPMQRDAWRKKASPTSGLDCVILDALAFNCDSSGGETLELVSIEVAKGSDDDGVSVPDHTDVVMSYGGTRFKVTLEGGDESGERSFDVRRGFVKGQGTRGASLSLVFSSHAFICSSIGYGRWDVGCPVLKSRVIGITDGAGLDGIAVNGSEGVDGHDPEEDQNAASMASGDIFLEDGYRTSPIIYDGRVIVRVGKKYGYDPCKFDFGDSGVVDCRRPLFFFCGQNAINSGNIMIKGGAGISVSQGREYTVRSGRCAGKSIPCIEIRADKELIDICKPSDG